MASGERYKEAVSCVERQAVDAFARHVLTVKRPWLWKVSRPDSWVYGFFVVMAPGALIMYGDLGEAVFRMHAGSEKDVFEWTMRCTKDRYYVLSKIANREAFKKFYSGDAVEYAKSCLDESKSQKDRDFYVEVQQRDADGDLSRDEFYRIAAEHEQYDVPGFEEWSAGAIWLHAALETFVRLTPEMPAGE